MQRAVDDFLSEHTIPGAGVAVIVGDDHIEVTAGVRDVRTRRAVARDDEFRLASITKNYVSALALSLVDERVIRLDDTVDRWLPHVNRALPYLHGITLRQLLSHTTGIAQTATADEDRGKELSTDDLIARIPAPACDPGTCWNYADGNYIVAGLMLEAATSRSLDALVQSRLLKPLHLTETHFVATASSPPVQPYVLAVGSRDYEPVVPHQLREQLLPIVAPIGSTGMMASAGDVARWADALFGGRILTDAGLDQMLDTRPMQGLPRADGYSRDYGLGVVHYEFADRTLVGHDGSSGTIVAHDLDSGMTVAILTNGGEPDIGAFLEHVLAALD